MNLALGEVDTDFDRDRFSEDEDEEDVGDVEEAEVIAHSGKNSWNEVTGLSESLSRGR